jgi:hypothetical protein
MPRRSRRSLYTTSAAFSLACAIAGWLFLFTSWGFSSLLGPVGLLAALPGLWAPKKVVPVLAVALNALLSVFCLFWLEVLPP